VYSPFVDCRHFSREYWSDGVLEYCSMKAGVGASEKMWIMLSTRFPAHYSRCGGTSRFSTDQLAKAIRDLK